MYSIGSMLSSLHFLKSVKNEPVSAKNISKQETYVYTTPSIIQDILEKTSCIVKKDDLWYITDKGENFLETENLFSIKMNEKVKEKVRSLLKESLLNSNHSWIKHVYKGRLECLKRIKNSTERRDMAFLLQELNLLRETTEEAVEWWEEIIKHCHPIDEEKEEIGKKGELLSIKYEKERIGKEPRWESRFSNLSGYDLLSQISKKRVEPLRIEVKASKSLFTFYLTRGEWKKANESISYIFHFWNLTNEELFMFSPNDIRNHISINQGNGEWTVCEITLSEQEQKKFKLI